MRGCCLVVEEWTWEEIDPVLEKWFLLCRNACWRKYVVTLEHLGGTIINRRIHAL